MGQPHSVYEYRPTRRSQPRRSNSLNDAEGLLRDGINITTTSIIINETSNRRSASDTFTTASVAGATTAAATDTADTTATTAIMTPPLSNSGGGSTHSRSSSWLSLGGVLRHSHHSHSHGTTAAVDRDDTNTSASSGRFSVLRGYSFRGLGGGGSSGSAHHRSSHSTSSSPTRRRNSHNSSLQDEDEEDEDEDSAEDFSDSREEEEAKEVRSSSSSLNLQQQQQPNLDEPPSLIDFEEYPDDELAGSSTTISTTTMLEHHHQQQQSLDRNTHNKTPPPPLHSILSRSGNNSATALDPNSNGVVAQQHPQQTQQQRTTPTTPLNVSFDNSRPDTNNNLIIIMDQEKQGNFSNMSSSAAGAANNQVYREFFPQASRDYEWMGRSIESLILGHAVARAPILQLEDDDLDDYRFCFMTTTPTVITGTGISGNITGIGSNAADEVGGDELSTLDCYYDSMYRRRSTASTFGGDGGRRRSSQGSFPGGRRGSLSLSGAHGGTMASYYNDRRYPQRQQQTPTDVDRGGGTNSGGGGGGSSGRRGSIIATTSHTPMYRRRSSMATSSLGGGGGAGGASDGSNYLGSGGRGGRKGDEGPNIVYSIMARESTGKSCFPRGIPNTQCLRSMGGHALYCKLDKPADGIATEVAFLAAAVDSGDWTETHTIVSRLAPRIIGDPMAATPHDLRPATIDDPNLHPTAPRFYAGGGRVGLERDAFVQAGGVEVLLRVFREKSFVGQEMAYSYDARDLSPEILASRLAQCWNEALACLRELVFSIPALVEDRKISDNEEFLPFLFSLLSHDSCFDGAAALIEEILALLSQTPQQQMTADPELAIGEVFQPTGRVSSPTTFFLGNIRDLYKLWAGFNGRQLAHFCRILALLVFEPEDRQLLESPAVLKSLELLQLRRNRAVRASRDSTVDMNQAILLGDQQLIRRLLMLLRVMNFAPSLRRIAPYHIMAQYPLIADTLVMLGLGELESWNEIDRQEQLARKLLECEEEGEYNNNNEEEEDNDSPPAPLVDDAPEPLLCELGSVADMLEGLSETLRDAPNQIGHIIHVISAAQQAGVIVGRNSGSRGSRRQGGNQQQRNQHAGRQSSSSGNSPTPEDQEVAAEALRLGGIPVDNATIQGLASVAGILTDQVLVRRLYQSTGQDLDGGSGFGDAGDDDLINGSRHFINTPEDSANSLQFNAILLGSYQVEVLFVLCTLLGGRRKLDAQDMLERLGIVQVLEDMFQRLPWFKRATQASSEEGPSDRPFADGQPNGIHGPGCECTPESALCVQYLRLLHNFCDRDCDNYSGRRLLLSQSERNYVFRGITKGYGRPLKPGLLSKVIGAFMKESDESPYRFWLASCIESYLRGSSPEEQMFVAQTGLMTHLIDDVSSDRLHCAGSLQTSFDLLGELGKGNSDIVRLLVNDLDEGSFRKLMSVAAANLVDSNVFIRSLLLSLERLSSAESLGPLYIDAGASGLRSPMWNSQCGSDSRSYLTHSWWDTKSLSLAEAELTESDFEVSDEGRPSDWFPTRELLDVSRSPHTDFALLPAGLEESVGHFGWVFTPGGDSLSPNTYLSNTVERLSWFLAANQARLLRDLLGVVDLRNINHENICCLNTAVVIAIFAHRRRQLSMLLEELREMNDEEKETKRRSIDADDIVDRAFAQAMRYLDLDQRETPPYARMASIASAASYSSSHQIGDRTDVMRNFREVLWFWTEYYSHRGRDRLSLEFSSHLRFQEWANVVSLLSADDGSPTALVRGPPRLPRSPYQRAARIAGSPVRGV